MKALSRRTFGLIVAAAVAARLVLLATPFPYVPDIYYYDTQAVQALLGGADPYGRHYVVPAALATSGAETVYAYLPWVVAFLFPFGVAGEVRLGLVACDIIIALTLYALRGRWAGAAAAAYLLLPSTMLFSTWYPNNTLVAMAMLGVALAFEAGERHVTSAVFVGLALASSQFVWVAYPFFLLQYLKDRRYREVTVGLLTASATVAPFILWSPSAFFNNTLFFQFGRPVQSLVTPEAFGVNVNPTLSGFAMTFAGVSVPLLLKGAILALLLALLLRRTLSPPQRLLNGSYFLLATILVLPNDFAWWYLELPFQMLLAWFLSSSRIPAIPVVNA